MTWQTKWVRSRPEFKKANRILEIGSGAFGTIKEVAVQYPDKEFVGLDFELSRKARETLETIPPNLTVVRHDARTLGLFGEDYFDLVFSIAVMEHIHELADHLQEVHRIVRPGGSYWFWEAPFWSSSMGHHYRQKDCQVPHYGHLYATRDELAAGGVSDHALARIYDRGDLSRLSRTETKRLCADSPFSVVEWTDDPDQHYSEELSKKVLARNLFEVSEEDLRFKGAKVHLRSDGPSAASTTPDSSSPEGTGVVRPSRPESGRRRLRWTGRG